MKNTPVKWVIALLLITFALHSNTYAQTVTKRYPDGTVVYSDGTVALPNGQVRYPNTTYGKTYPSNYPDYGTGRYPRTSTRQADGSIIYPDGRIVYPDGTVRYPDGRVYSPSHNSRWIPPGQAKKMYGSKSARQYAPGHNKNRNKYYHEQQKKEWKQEEKVMKQQHKMEEKSWKEQHKHHK
jgi:hypothetical protein